MSPTRIIKHRDDDCLARPYDSHRPVLLLLIELDKLLIAHLVANGLSKDNDQNRHGDGHALDPLELGTVVVFVSGRDGSVDAQCEGNNVGPREQKDELFVEG